jgi:hypothetical protein
MDGASRRAQDVKYNKSGMRRSGPKAQKEIAEADAAYEKSTKAYRESIKQGEAFTQKYGLSYVAAWEAKNDRRWPNYRVDSSAGAKTTHYVKD